MIKKYFAIIVGSSFAGSLLAWILQRHGKDVLLIDRTYHPRFAIGESSTPVADFLLEHLADRWNLPEIRSLSRWGTWKRDFPNLRCGKKRGFSYYEHREGEKFAEPHQGKRSMLVAASRDDLQSDTQWLRSDVDRYFYDSAIQSGVDSLVNSNIESLLRDHGRRKWNAVVSTEFDGLQHVEADWLIDSSGSGVALSKWLGTNDDSEWMHVKTGAVFGHFTNVAPFSSQLYRAEEDIRNYFDGDDAAQHHLVDQGWFWMLRFDHGVTSVGRVFPSQDLAEYASGKMLWEESLRRYPAVAELLRNSECIAPQGGLATIKRMSRCSSKAVGRGWLAMPTTFGFVDPLHSTGIAHGLSGVCRAAEILLGEESNVESKLTIYERELREEVKWIDSLVGGCYAAQRSFPKFCAMTCLYFLGAIQTERELRNSNVESGNGFLGYRDRKLQLLQANLHQRLLQEPNEEPERFLDDVRREIEPWNDVGLLDRANPFRVAHTVDK